MTDLPKITVAIPVGPEKHHAKYLDECLTSVAKQTHPVDEVLLIDDMHGLDHSRAATIVLGDNHSGQTGPPEMPVYWNKQQHFRVWRAPWRLGVPQAFNFGVALAMHDLVFMLGADDKLMPECIERCLLSYRQHQGRDAYYWVGVEYSDEREDQYLPCNAAMVTKRLWRASGGFPVESGSGACDAALLSIFHGNPATFGRVLIGVDVKRRPLYWYRVHDQTDTASRGGAWQGVILETRDLVTSGWRAPTWGRFE